MGQNKKNLKSKKTLPYLEKFYITVSVYLVQWLQVNIIFDVFLKLLLLLFSISFNNVWLLSACR